MSNELNNIEQLVERFVEQLRLLESLIPVENLLLLQSTSDLMLRELKKTEAFFEGLINNVREAITVVDERGIVTHWNATSQELYNIPQNEIVGRPLADFGWKSLMLGRILEDGLSVEQLYHEPKPGTHVLINAAPIKLGGNIIGGIAAEQDVTKLVKLNNELTSTSSQLRNLEQEMTRMSLLQDDPFAKIRGNGPTIARPIHMARKVARTNATVLLTGESGVGKELFASAIHQASLRSKGPFAAINCGAIPAALFESEIFGYQGGAFTGAERSGRAGRLEMAHGGTLFLDEIGELPLDMQVKLLRVLQDGQFFRVGGNKPITVDTRVIAATNRSLEDMIEKGEFRRDLYYRLNVVTIEVPSLRERVEDIPELMQLFLYENALHYNRPVPTLDPEVIVRLMHYSWPGNVRQLRNVAERLIILTEKEVISVEDLPFIMTSNRSSVHSLLPSEPNLSDRERILMVLEQTGGNKSKAAEILGISRGTLYNKLRRYGVEP